MTDETSALPRYRRSVLQRLGAQRIRLARQIKANRDALYPMIAAAVAADERSDDIATWTGYHRDVVREIAAKHGIVRTHGGDRKSARRAA